MFRQRSVDRCLRWGLLLALVLVTLAPSVAHALRHLRGDTMPWSQLCSATGSKQLILGPTDADTQLPRSHASDHCAYCAAHHDGIAAAPAAAALALRADLARPAPLGALNAPRAPDSWPDALPRAPPAQA